jgi:tripartite-type tricarboxylate transporter receptor subunit TctC
MQRVFRFLPALLFSLLVALPAETAGAAQYPTREVRMIIPWNPGGSNDIMARTVQPVLEKHGIKIIVENIPGGSSAVGLGQVANAKPDGYTLGWATSSILSVIAEGKVPLSLAQYTPLVQASEDPLLLLVSKDSTTRNIKEFMKNVKANPGKVTIATPGARSVNDLLAVEATRAAGSSHRSVPYPGGSRVVAELIGGQVNAAVLKPGETMQVIKSGDLIPIACLTKERLSIFPDIPTLEENGYDIFPNGPLIQMSFIVAPAKLPNSIKAILVDAFTKAFSSKEFQNFAELNGFISNPVSGEKLDAKVKGVENALKIALKQFASK